MVGPVSLPPVRAPARSNTNKQTKPFMDAAQVLDRVVARFIGTKQERDVKKLQPSVAAINEHEAEVKALSDDELKARFQALKGPIQDQLKELDPTEPTFRESMRKALEPAIVPAFAMVREAGR